MDTNSQPVLKKTITLVEEIHGEAFFCVSLFPSDFESGTFVSVSFGLSLEECLERYNKGDFLTDVTSSLTSNWIEFCLQGVSGAS